jgi:hypothetical protein
MSTYRYIAYDLEKSLRKNFDDSQLTFSQIVYWIIVVANKLRVGQYLQTNTDLFTSTFTSVPVEKDVKGRKYVTLPKQIIDLPNQRGIKYISYTFGDSPNGYSFAQTFFQPTFTGQIQHLYLDEYTKPSPKNPYFYRVGQDFNGISVDRLYLIGIENVEIDDVEMAILSTLDPKTIVDLDDEIPLPDELVLELTTQILQLGRMILMMPEERINQGSDSPQGQVPQGNVSIPQTQTQQTAE